MSQVSTLELILLIILHFVSFLKLAVCHDDLPSCTTLSHWNPQISKCKINNHVYQIEQLEKQKDSIYFDYEVFSDEQNTDTKVMRMASKEFTNEILNAYSVQYSIYQNLSKMPETYHLSQYLDRPNIINQTHPSIAIIMKWYHFINLDSFITYIRNEFKHQSAENKEYFAIHSWCRLMKHISMALEFIFTKFQLTVKELRSTDIYIQVQRFKSKYLLFSYFLDGLENVIDLNKYFIKDAPFDDYTKIHQLFITKGIMNNLVSLGFDFYAQLCSENALFKLNGAEKDLSGIECNIFCTRIKSFVNEFEFDEDDFVQIQRKTLRKKSMLKELLHSIADPDTNNTKMVELLFGKTVEYHVIKFMANYGMLNLDTTKTFTTFNYELDGLCENFYDKPMYN